MARATGRDESKENTASEASEPEETGTREDRREHPNQQFIDGLRAMADFIEDHPQRPCFLTFNLFPQSAEEFREAIRGAGHVEKQTSSYYFYVRKEFSPAVSIDWNRPREEVCERIVTGKRIVEKPIMRQIGVEKVEEEIVDWKCPESILSAHAEPG